MCLTCGCNDAHREMGNNLTYEDLQKIAAGNGKSVEQSLAIIFETAKSDRRQHPNEYAAPQAAVPGGFKVGHDWDRREWAGEGGPAAEDSQRWNAGEWAGEANVPVGEAQAGAAGAGPTGGGHSPSEQHWSPPKK